VNDKIYAIDTCSLIDASKNYMLGKKSFNFIWEKFAEMFETGNLISNIEIYKEIKDDDLLNWIKDYKHCFLDSCKDIQEEVKSILDKYPNIIDVINNKSGADPFLIATAKVKNAIVVTNEKIVPDKSKRIKIPNVCQSINIECIDLVTFINSIID